MTREERERGLRELADSLNAAALTRVLLEPCSEGRLDRLYACRAYWTMAVEKPEWVVETLDRHIAENEAWVANLELARRRPMWLVRFWDWCCDCFWRFCVVGKKGRGAAPEDFYNAGADVGEEGAVPLEFDICGECGMWIDDDGECHNRACSSNFNEGD